MWDDCIALTHCSTWAFFGRSRWLMNYYFVDAYMNSFTYFCKHFSKSCRTVVFDNGLRSNWYTYACCVIWTTHLTYSYLSFFMKACNFCSSSVLCNSWTTSYYFYDGHQTTHAFTIGSCFWPHTGLQTFSTRLFGFLSCYRWYIYIIYYYLRKLLIKVTFSTSVEGDIDFILYITSS